MLVREGMFNSGILDGYDNISSETRVYEIEVKKMAREW